MTLSSPGQTAGNQTLKNFTLDGDGKRLHGGIYVKFRSNVIFKASRYRTQIFVVFGYGM